MNADGSGRYKLTQPTQQNFNYATGDKPTWSPDSKKIAFHRVMIPESAGNTEIFVINADGSNERQLTSTPNISETIESWSADGGYLFFSYYDSSIKDTFGTYNSSQIARMRIADGSTQTITTDTSGGSGGIISPSDSTIALGGFVTFRTIPGYGYQLQIMNVDGSNRHAVKQNTYRYEVAVSWSSNSHMILYNTRDDEQVAHQNPPQEIMITNLDGSMLKRITPFDYKVCYYYATSWRR